ncbi:lipopolysaccharide/colanic/teichoic acid biosynthesis glycosyltransferase [Epilithonimonas hungarica]|uniref:sugar transferase n=1 Tax=Epilithonimonas hungarica TaxID=454006 RepID=UPI002788A0F9|nr:sugar transferase [Epilithonimonas hungarica]MDP9954601.1 lipopolysaccharide/colanic/teichoic acid biosynthesis glycosyltransferase [Epilithonimonas hungarica]
MDNDLKGYLLIKRIFDIVFSLLALFFFGWVIIIGFVLSSVDTFSNGFFLQERIGQYGKVFTIFKLKTIHPKKEKISYIGRFLRTYKVDELPQLLNVLLGNMSFVGPRPDVAGYYDLLEGENRKILDLKPGITSLASIKYADEESLLLKQNEPLKYNDEIIFPDKVKMNLDYYYKRSFGLDIKIIVKTFIKL